MMYDAYLRFPRAFYDRHATGEVISRATNDIYPVRYFIGWGVVQAIQSVMMLVGAAIVLISVNARLTLFAALAMPPIAVLTYVFAHKVFPISRIVQAKKGNLTEATDEAVSGSRWCRHSAARTTCASGSAIAPRPSAPRRCGRRAIEARFLPGPDLPPVARDRRRALLRRHATRSPARSRSASSRCSSRCCCSSSGRSRHSAGSSTSASGRRPPRRGRSRGSTRSSRSPSPTTRRSCRTAR